MSDDFEAEVEARLERAATDTQLKASAATFMRDSILAKYSYNFAWLGRPIIQYPQDIVGLQELIWSVRPDVIVETGIAHGGSLIFSASMLALLDITDALDAGDAVLDLGVSKRRVIGIDIDIRSHNRDAVEAHPFSRWITMLEGSSTDAATVAQVNDAIGDAGTVMVFLDSNHTHDHVFAELKAYTPFVTRGSYCVVLDTVIEDLPEEYFGDRPWGPGDNPMTAVREFLAGEPAFALDESYDSKLMISVARNGFLRRVS
jgi:cephalosporin hydroxylase